MRDKAIASGLLKPLSVMTMKPASPAPGLPAPEAALSGSSAPEPPPPATADLAYAIARQAIVASAPTIVEEVIKKAKEGSYLHAKFLFELAEIAPPSQSPADAEASPAQDHSPEHGLSLAQLLLSRLEAGDAAQ